MGLEGRVTPQLAGVHVRWRAALQAKELLAVVFGVQSADRQSGREGSRLIHPQSPFAQGERRGAKGGEELTT